jgi:hypothetical protein
VIAPLLLTLLGHCPDGGHLRYLAREAGIPPARLEAVARVESGCNLSPRLRAHWCWHGVQAEKVSQGDGLPAPEVRRPAVHARDCEVGRFQVKPSTARRWCPGLDVFAYRGNTACAVRFLARLLDAWGVVGIARFNGERCDTYLCKVLREEERLQ